MPDNTVYRSPYVLSPKRGKHQLKVDRNPSVRPPLTLQLRSHICRISAAGGYTLSASLGSEAEETGGIWFRLLRVPAVPPLPPQPHGHPLNMTSDPLNSRAQLCPEVNQTLSPHLLRTLREVPCSSQRNTATAEDCRQRHYMDDYPRTL
ncbi:hypothetical protein DPEC_G00073540 [Dallia pectoralis]|uniref:Uncharacterized protein n=1 Tax=Dallia pectoralis TaxID=75939 RepID=A0ACC2H331_DALPE|nr:hypothetical protein DPEC_G00073540 [Dallia pectoralis]